MEFQKIKFEKWNLGELNLEFEVFLKKLDFDSKRFKKKKFNALENSHAQSCTCGGVECKGRAAL